MPYPVARVARPRAAAPTKSVATGSSMLCSTKRSSRGHFVVGSKVPSTRRCVKPLPRAHFASAVYRPLRATISGASSVMRLAAILLEQPRRDGIGGLRLDPGARSPGSIARPA